MLQHTYHETVTKLFPVQWGITSHAQGAREKHIKPLLLSGIASAGQSTDRQVSAEALSHLKPLPA